MLLSAVLLTGCSQVPDYVNPGSWMSKRPEAVEADKAGAEADFPSPGGTDRPVVRTAREQGEIAQGLAADRANAKYAEGYVNREGTPTRPLINDTGAAKAPAVVPPAVTSSPIAEPAAVSVLRKSAPATAQGPVSTPVATAPVAAPTPAVTAPVPAAPAPAPAPAAPVRPAMLAMPPKPYAAKDGPASLPVPTSLAAAAAAPAATAPIAAPPAASTPVAPPAAAPPAAAPPAAAPPAAAPPAAAPARPAPAAAPVAAAVPSAPVVATATAPAPAPATPAPQAEPETVDEVYRRRLTEFDEGSAPHPAAPVAPDRGHAPTRLAQLGDSQAIHLIPPSELHRKPPNGIRPLDEFVEGGSAVSFQVASLAFAEGTVELSAADRARLKEVAALARENNGKLRVVGHSASRHLDPNSSANREANRQLARQRADAVAIELLRLGVPSAKIYAGPALASDSVAATDVTDIVLDY